MNGGIERLDMAESGMAKMVDSRDERKRSGEMWRRVEMKLNPLDRSNWVTFDTRSRGGSLWWRTWWCCEWMMMAVMPARSMVAKMKNRTLPISERNNSVRRKKKKKKEDDGFA